MIPEPITQYRNWILTSSIIARLLLLVGVFVLFIVAGSGSDLLIATLPRLLVRLIYLLVILFILYTLYAIARSFIPGYSDPDGSA